MIISGILAAINVIVFILLSFGGATEDAYYMYEKGAMFVPAILYDQESAHTLNDSARLRDEGGVGNFDGEAASAACRWVDRGKLNLVFADLAVLKSTENGCRAAPDLVLVCYG